MRSSSHDNTSYISTQLSKDIKNGLLPNMYHVVLDEAYPCTEQEMSPWKGRNLSVEKDAFNYYLSLCRQVIERAFGILVQRWGIFWRPLRLSMNHRGVVIRTACKLHNICIDDFGSCRRRIQTIHRHSNVDFTQESDDRDGDTRVLQFTDGTPMMTRGYRSDLERCSHRDSWTNQIRDQGLMRPDHSTYSRSTIRP